VLVAETLATAEKKLNADLNAPVNIAHRAGYEVVIKKIESYKVTHNGIKPITPAGGGKPETPASRDPILTINAIAPRDLYSRKGLNTQYMIAIRAIERSTIELN